MRRLFFLSAIAVFLLAATIYGCAAWIQKNGKARVYDRAETIPPREIGLVLGTTEKRRDGGENPYFELRMDAAAKLYRLGKVKRLLVSGYNRPHGQNEPEEMKRALIARHLPARAITMDPEGERTLDSIIRARDMLGRSHNFTVISQRDHDERALLIARYYHIDAIAYAADDVPFRKAILAHVHEWFAQIKVILDLYVLHTLPRHPWRR